MVSSTGGGGGGCGPTTPEGTPAALGCGCSFGAISTSTGGGGSGGGSTTDMVVDDVVELNGAGVVAFEVVNHITPKLTHSSLTTW